MIDGKDFLVVAEELVKGGTEAEWRSAVSRAYYAAFHEARQLMRDLRFQVPKAETAHPYLWHRLMNSADTQVVSAGSDLNALRTDRNRADYENGLTLTQLNCRLAVQTARKLIQILNNALTEPTRTQITDAMKIYERDVLKQMTWQP